MDNTNKPEEQKPKPTENACPHCGATMIGSNHGMRLDCINSECGFGMGPKEDKTSNEDTVTT